jgi:hypothetical protein
VAYVPNVPPVLDSFVTVLLFWLATQMW